MSDSLRKNIEDLIREMSSAVQVGLMYGRAHKFYSESVDKLYFKITNVLTERDEITVGVIGDEIAFDREPFYEISRQVTGLIEHLKGIKAEKISFLRNIEKKEIDEFFRIILMKPADVEKGGGFDPLFKASRIRHIAIGKIGYKKKMEPKQLREEDFMSLSRNCYQQGLDYLTESLEVIEEGQPIDIKSARELINGIVSNFLTNKTLLLILTSTKSHDESTFIHDINVSIFTILQAESLGFERDTINELGVSALLHDVGKLHVSGDILRKKGGLTDEERALIQKHPVWGAKILIETPDMDPIAAVTAFEHHILFDGSGYPERLYKDDIGITSMIVTIADFYDALRSERAYAGGEAPEKTYEDMMKLSGTHFHPELLRNFFSLIGVYPPGTLVELDSKEIGIVVKSSAIDIWRPQVEVLYDNKGDKEKAPYTVNLLEKNSEGLYSKTIRRSIQPSDKFKAPGKYA